MLGKLEAELSKLIAQELYKYAKQAGSGIHRSLKKTQLTKGGRGLPEPVLAEFEKAFIETLDDYWLKEHGYAKWRFNGSEKEFFFLLCNPLISNISQSNWVGAAENTAEGNNQIQALGGADKYQAAVTAAIAPTFDCAIKNICGEYHRKTDTSGWTVLTPVITTAVARKGTTKFEPMRLFYKSDGDAKKARQDLKLAKKLITGTLLGKGALPCTGPYLND